MLKLAYLTHSNTSNSETFIADLINGLNLNQDIELTFISGNSISVKTDASYPIINAGFSDCKPSLKNRIYRISQLRNKGEQNLLNFEKWLAQKQLRKCKLPSFDIAFIEYATTAVLIAGYLEANRIPFIVHVHGYDITSATNNVAYKKDLEKLFAKAKYFIAASNYIKRRLILLGCDEEKIKVIHLGVSGENIYPQVWKEKTQKPPSIIFLGRLTEKKHPVALLHAFKIVRNQIPDATLSIIGDGYLKEIVLNTIVELNLKECVTIHGALSREESFPLLNNHWIYAQHSVTATSGDTEGFAISMAEAALHGLPVVSTIHNGIVENVIESKTGYLVPEYDYEAMAQKIIYLIQNPKIAEQMGKAGREHILKLCEPGKRVEKIKTLLFEAAKKQQ
ncbi:glycosyltransferase [Natronoflexus pectinivorans]|uniref:Glycosyltransferase involved in cell wall biosynthesis n=1 Tax=Natronoflexus pectinivorans TaxID=682526 RepID=A0A4R2GHZ3_9BACT|nr:glycosyltransferase [Natronoflexus pectinivorans]TCO06899.1 glycosyltransferase involved in cell wall biosynthesis [Natronoflexus pectinivorans]